MTKVNIMQTEYSINKNTIVQINHSEHAQSGNGNSFFDKCTTDTFQIGTRKGRMDG